MANVIPGPQWAMMRFPNDLEAGARLIKRDRLIVTLEVRDLLLGEDWR